MATTGRCGIHQLEVSAISFRNDPIYQTIIPGWYEHIYIGNILPREPLLRKHIRHIDPNADVIIPPYGNGFMAVIQIDRDNPGTPKTWQWQQCQHTSTYEMLLL